MASNKRNIFPNNIIKQVIRRVDAILNPIIKTIKQKVLLIHTVLEESEIKFVIIPRNIIFSQDILRFENSSAIDWSFKWL